MPYGRRRLCLIAGLPYTVSLSYYIIPRCRLARIRGIHPFERGRHIRFSEWYPPKRAAPSASPYSKGSYAVMRESRTAHYEMLVPNDTAYPVFLRLYKINAAQYTFL